MTDMLERLAAENTQLLADRARLMAERDRLREGVAAVRELVEGGLRGDPKDEFDRGVRAARLALRDDLDMYVPMSDENLTHKKDVLTVLPEDVVAMCERLRDSNTTRNKQEAADMLERLAAQAARWEAARVEIAATLAGFAPDLETDTEFEGAVKWASKMSYRQVLAILDRASGTGEADNG